MILFRATASVVEVRDAAFSTDYRYIRENATGSFALVAGATAGAIVQNAGVDGSNIVYGRIFWKYACGSYSIEKFRPPSYINASGVVTPQTINPPTITGSVNQVIA